MYILLPFGPRFPRSPFSPDGPVNRKCTRIGKSFKKKLCI